MSICFPLYIHIITILQPYYNHIISLLYPYYIHIITILYPLLLVKFHICCLKCRTHRATKKSPRHECFTAVQLGEARNISMDATDVHGDFMGKLSKKAWNHGDLMRFHGIASAMKWWSITGADWNMTGLWLFHRECHHPNWLTHIFQRGGEKPPTSNGDFS